MLWFILLPNLQKSHLPLCRCGDVALHGDRTDRTTPSVRQKIQIVVIEFVDQTSVIVYQLLAVLGDSHADYPPIQCLLVLGAQILYVLGALRLLQPWVFDGETEIRRRFILLLPAVPIVDLIDLERRQTDQIFRRF